MSRRHHHHNIQPYDYERFRERDQSRGIEYQDDSLSSINSDEESYVHGLHSNKERKSNYYNSKGTDKHKSDNHHQKDTKTASQSTDSTAERLGRLEAMLEQLVKRNNTTQASANLPSLDLTPNETNDVHNQFLLEPRRHDFTTSMWINRIQEVSIKNNWNEKNTIQFMCSKMSGIVKAWYNSLTSYDFTWPEWKILIARIFPDNTDFVTTLKRLVTRLKQADESINTYYFSKMYLVEACKIAGEDAVSCLIDGLNNQEIQEQAKAMNYLTPETLYTQFLLTLPDYTVDYAPTSDVVLNSWYQQPEAPQEEQFEFEQEPREEEFDYTNQEVSTRSAKSSPKRTGTVHSRLDKRFIKPSRNPHYKIPLAARVCSICNGRGHLAKYCRNTEKIKYCQPVGTKSTKWFYKNCQINGVSLTGFIDTGCTTITIKDECIKKLHLVIEPTSDVFIQVYGGGIVGVLGQVEVNLSVDSIEKRVRLLVVPNEVQDVDVIIGQAFLNLKNISMFLHNETLKIFDASTCPKLTK